MISCDHFNSIQILVELEAEEFIVPCDKLMNEYTFKMHSGVSDAKEQHA